MGRLDEALRLRSGRNYIVYELENGPGYCAGSFRLYVNGKQLEGVPGVLPANVQEIHGISGAADLPIEGAVCSRRVVEIDLGIGPEPIHRFPHDVRS